MEIHIKVHLAIIMIRPHIIPSSISCLKAGSDGIRRCRQVENSLWRGYNTGKHHQLEGPEVESTSWAFFLASYRLNLDFDVRQRVCHMLYHRLFQNILPFFRRNENLQLSYCYCQKIWLPNIIRRRCQHNKRPHPRYSCNSSVPVLWRKCALYSQPKRYLSCHFSWYFITPVLFLNQCILNMLSIFFRNSQKNMRVSPIFTNHAQFTFSQQNRDEPRQK